MVQKARLPCIRAPHERHIPRPSGRRGVVGDIGFLARHRAVKLPRPCGHLKVVKPGPPIFPPMQLPFVVRDLSQRLFRNVPVRIAIAEIMASIPPEAPSKWPVMLLVELMATE